MKHTITATSGLPGDTSFTVIIFTVESETETSSEAMDLVRRAVKRYAMTDEGLAEYEGNCGNFNWGDVINNYHSKTFRTICEEMNLNISWNTTAGENWVHLGESLMNDIDVAVDSIEWEDGNDDLPQEVHLVLDSPDKDIADALSDEYGFLVKSYHAEVV